MTSSPAPPSSSDHGTPSSPSSPIFLTFSQGNLPSASQCAAVGATSSRANCRTISRVARCCSVKYSASSMVSLGCFGFVGGADDGKKPFSVALELCRSDTANVRKRRRCSRAPYRDLRQSSIRKGEVRRNLLLLRDLSPQRSQPVEQRAIRSIYNRFLVRSGDIGAARLCRLLDPGRPRRAALGGMRTEAVVAALAPWSGGGVAEVPQHETTPTVLQIRVLLHCVHLGQLCPASAIEQLPVDLVAVNLVLGMLEEISSSKALPLHELPRLKRVEQWHRARRTAKTRWQRVEIYRGPFLDARCRHAPEGAKKTKLHRVRLPAELALDPLRGGEQPHEGAGAVLGKLLVCTGSDENAQRAFDLANIDLAPDARGDVLCR